jgi:hypothetical protein
MGGIMANAAERLNLEPLNELTRSPLERGRTVSFAGVLVREEDDAVFVADLQGTWVVPRSALVGLSDWTPAGRCLPERLAEQGRPVRVTVNRGATIHELRPWHLAVDPIPAPVDTKIADVQRIFTLGGAPPIAEGTRIGEEHVRQLAQVFGRRLGWHPDICNDPRAHHSHTFECLDPECSKTVPDTDEGF